MCVECFYNLSIRIVGSKFNLPYYSDLLFELSLSNGSNRKIPLFMHIIYRIVGRWMFWLYFENGGGLLDIFKIVMSF